MPEKNSMDDLVKPAVRSGGTEPASFPHVCPFQEKGISSEQCTGLTLIFIRNKDGCCRVKCNCVNRRCILCLSLGRRGHDVKKVAHPETGLCAEHADAQPEAPRRREAPPPRPRFGIQPYPTGSELRTRNQSEKKPMTLLTRSQYDAVDSLDGEEILVLQKVAYGYDENAIEHDLKELDGRSSERSVQQILRDIYQKLELLDLENGAKMRHAAAKRYVHYSDMNREGVEPTEEGESPSAPDAMESDAAGQEPPSGSEPAAGDTEAEEGPAGTVVAENGSSGTAEDERIAKAIQSLDPRALSVLRVCVRGLDNQAIADKLNQTYAVVGLEMGRVYKAFGVAHLPKKEKRPAVIAMYRRLIAASGGVLESKPEPTPTVPEKSDTDATTVAKTPPVSPADVPEALTDTSPTQCSGAGTAFFFPDPATVEGVVVLPTADGQGCLDHGFRREGIIVYPTLPSGLIPVQHIFIKRTANN
ncbi:hypothetical protein HY418_03215 [Candidatus Kaiserbacteria bacterium]|nr:hypothetical protein [Candidatus Kaiserbacteria bacterium]